MNELDRLSKYVGKEVRLKPFHGTAGMLNGLYFNEDMSKAVRENPIVKVMSVERIKDHYEFIALFSDNQRWYILESWIDQVVKNCYLFI